MQPVTKGSKVLTPDGPALIIHTPIHPENQYVLMYEWVEDETSFIIFRACIREEFFTPEDELQMLSDPSYPQPPGE